MTKIPAELMREFVRSQNFTSTDDIMAAMKEMFRDVLQQVMECELATDDRPQKCVSGNQRRRDYEQPDSFQGQMGQNLSVLCKELGRKLGYTTHIFAYPPKARKIILYNEHHRRIKPSI